MIDETRPMRIVLAHDWLVGLRGGEHVLDRLAQLYGPTVIYTLVARGPGLTPAIAECKVVTSPLQKFPGAAGRLRRMYLPLMPWAVKRLRVEPCSLLISTSSAVIKSIRAPAGVPHLCYCHSPARYIWSQRRDYSVGAGGRTRSLGLGAVARWFQNWDRATAANVTRFLANSEHTARRIKECFDREASVVYPPVRTAFFTPEASVAREDWFLLAGALEPYKRADLVIEAANQRGLPLRIAGTGSQYKLLAVKAGPTVEMLGRVSDEKLRDLFRRARALIHPQQEDFGITAVEAQACGCPVVAFEAGGARETVTERTGVFFRAQSADAILHAIHELNNRFISPADCRTNAERFCPERFDEAIQEHVRELLAGAKG
jgi:glycosyltransferase involved in cell wall biosynthesis